MIDAGTNMPKVPIEVEEQELSTQIDGKKVKYYSLDSILEKDCTYNVIFGMRSNGKTYATLSYCLEQYKATGKQFAYLRRLDTTIKGHMGGQIFDGHTATGFISKLFGGKWTCIKYKDRAFWLAKMVKQKNGDEKLVLDSKPCGYAFALNLAENYKGLSFPDISTIVFDEFITEKYYLVNEYTSCFQSLVSTIVRQRAGVKIFLLGNTISVYCPYFDEMNLVHVKTQKIGTIDVYDDSETSVAVEYCSVLHQSEAVNQYFGFKNSKLKMITEGAWQLGDYPHLPMRYRPKDVKFTFYILFDHEEYQGDIINITGNTFIYIHRRTTPYNHDKDLFFSTDYSPKPNWRRNILKGTLKVERVIARYFHDEKVFFEDNMIGNAIMSGYLGWCESES